MTTNGSPRAVNAALAGLSTLLALAAGEAAVRLLRPQFVVEANPVQPLFWRQAAGFYRHDPDVGWRMVSGARVTFTRPEFSHPVSVNSSGWRDRERALDRPAGVYRVVVLGDSFTFGHGVADDEVFTRRLETLLHGVEVLNFGLSGSSTDQQLLILKRDALAYHPDLVLTMVSRNDFTGNLSTRDGPYSKPAFVLDAGGSLRLTNVPVPDVTLLARLHDGLLRRSALLNLTESALGSLAEYAPSAGAGSKTRRQASYDMMRALLAAMRDASAEAGARFAAGIVPSNAHTYFDPIPPLEAERTRVLTECGAALGFPVLDLVPAFRAAARDPATGARVDLHYRRDQHWNTLGHEVAAAELARLLRQDGLIPGLPPP